MPPAGIYLLRYRPFPFVFFQCDPGNHRTGWSTRCRSTGRPAAAAAVNLAYPAGLIVSPATVSSSRNLAPSKRHPVRTFKEWASSQHVIVERNADYWDAQRETNRFRPSRRQYAGGGNANPVASITRVVRGTAGQSDSTAMRRSMSMNRPDPHFMGFNPESERPVCR